MDYSTAEQGFVFDMDSLYASFAALTDQRSRQGIRYPLPQALTLILLAKLGGEDTARGMATWLRLRAEELAQALQLARSSMPYRTTISRILGEAVDVKEFEETVGSFFRDGLAEKEDLIIAIDGKTLRGTIEAGQNQGLHLMAAYVPGAGVVLMQMEVTQKENEIVTAPHVLSCLDLSKRVVVGDAMQTQRELSAQITVQGGDYVWVVKENQPQLREDITAAFEPVPCVPGFNEGTRDQPTARTLDKGHGRIEERTITTTSELREFLDWPGAEQVFKLDRRFVYTKENRVRQETSYGITSLSTEKASPKKLLALIRAYWEIENGLHYRRDVTFQEDCCRLTIGHAAHMMAALNNLAIGLIEGSDYTDAPEARRHYCARPLETLSLICCA
jgi:predicted transposase YbfD/YdcC